MNSSIVPVVGLSCILLSCGSPTPGPQESGNKSASQAADRGGQVGQVPKAADAASRPGNKYNVQISAGDARTRVYETSKRGEIVLLELYNDKIVFTALISRCKFEEIMYLKPPTYFNYKDAEYVKNDVMFFGGEAGKEESVSVDGEMFGGFSLNGSQIAGEGEVVQAVLQAARSGDRLKLEKQYWGPNNKKGYPNFALSGLREDLDNLGSASATSFMVSDAQTQCKRAGPRKIVWIEADEGTFALNGPAIALVRTSTELGAPWRDAQGRPVRLGRDVLGVDVTSSLIEAGLRRCD